MPKRKRGPKRKKDGRASVEISPASAAVLHGEVDLSIFDDEELLGGRKRSADGSFKGRPPQVLPTEFLHELNRRRFSRAHALLASSLEDTIRMLLSIVNSEESADSDRIKAAEILLDRTLGKPTERVQLGIDGEPKWQRLVATAIVGTLDDAKALGPGDSAEAIDVEPVEEPEDVLIDPRTGEPEAIRRQPGRLCASAPLSTSLVPSLLLPSIGR